MSEATSVGFVVGTLLVMAISSLFGCKGEAGSSPPSPIPEVQVAEVIPQTVPDEPEFIGQTEASSIVDSITGHWNHPAALASRIKPVHL